MPTKRRTSSNKKSNGFKAININLTIEALELLDGEAKYRSIREGANVARARIVNELILKNIKEHSETAAQ